MRMDYWQAAQYLAVKIATLRTLVHRGQVPHIRLSGRLVVFDKAALDQWLADKAVPVGAKKKDEAAGGRS